MPSVQTQAVQQENLASVFEERAENLSKNELMSWTAEGARDRHIIAKLKMPGAKLLSGPRGSGKSTLLKKAYYDLLGGDDALPVYVNYSRSLALEPLFHRRSDAPQLFRQWVALKIVDGTASALREAEREEPPDVAALAREAKGFIQALETGSPPKELPKPIAPSALLALLERWTAACGMRRCVLLLDDAAHAFSPEQQRDFFEIFREMRSRVVSAKAAVYPGITSYSPYFQVGHEAELVEAWYQPEDAGYLEMMRDMYERRVPGELRNRLAGKSELIDYLALACFGLPRGFLLMLSQILGVEEDASVKPTRQSADKAIAAHAAIVRGIFEALKAKLPRYKNLLDVGEELQTAFVKALRQYNKNKSNTRKATVIALQEPIDSELSTILAMLEYAGIVRKIEPVSRGVKGRFQRYVLHYAMVLSENALSLGRAPATLAAITALRQRSAHAFVRARGASLLGEDYQRRCVLNLAPCPSCGASRVSPDASFCVKCGKELVESSVYEDLLRAPISALPLTKKKKDGLLSNTNIRTVQDVLLDEDTQKLRSVPYIGRVWAARIRNAALEFVSV
ncbi:hypothetical protein A2cp1_3697 [Anaeromyxobacter dehalogenans 2CP-1]|uniref:Zinc ribbon domain-containing protein n=1 Tax=Anaeromyxobacter dehalogenans (strain ATCC BAA-258 / DSM 21875 / 2CP-1) TaxID=455488 RepID=B8J6Q1_ANAD2|nr:hypothetical protein [Anaeromyxobacter dehalogenans]ACL67023.1 hypothetical protein A2cp1_3697 [Anaeromyxobacter dehalogenans 2CP-1]